MIELALLREEIREFSLLLSLPVSCEHAVRSQLSASEEENSHQNMAVPGTVILDFQPQNCEK